MTKYQQVFQNMLTKNQELFEEFKRIHNLYEEQALQASANEKEPNKYQKEFDEIGRDVQDVVRRYENILCGKSEGSGYGKFSTQLAEKFHLEIKKVFPKIDCVGLQVV